MTNQTFTCSICNLIKDIKHLGGAKGIQNSKELHQLLASYKQLNDELYHSEMTSLLDISSKEEELMKTITEVYKEIEKYNDIMICDTCLKASIEHAKTVRQEEIIFYCVICEVEYDGIPNKIHLDNRKVKVDPRKLVDICDNCARYARKKSEIYCPLSSDGSSNWKEPHRRYNCFCSIPSEKKKAEQDKRYWEDKFWKGSK